MVTRVLVTGARGNVGREVVRACADAGFQVRASDRGGGRAAASDAGHESVRLDFLDRSSWPDALAGCKHVFLLRPPPIGDMDETLIPFVERAYGAGIENVVFLSVAGADRMKWVPHRKVELYLAAHGRSWTVLRPGFFAQNLQDAYLRDIVEDRRIYVPAGSGRVAFLDVHDIGDVAARVFADPSSYAGRYLTLTGPEAVTFHDVARTLSTALGETIRYEPATIAGYAWHLHRRRNLPWPQIAIQTILHVGLRRGDAEKVDTTVAEILGRPPQSLREYVERAASTWRPAQR